MEPPFLKLYRVGLIQGMASLLPPSPLFDIMRYHLGLVDQEGKPAQATGKMVRPILCLLACKAVGGEPRQALPAACALELVHNFSLVHDDIEDGSDQRRHRPTVWRLFGEAQAINAGDAMYALAQLALLRLGETIPGRKRLHAIQVLTETCLRLCQGQYLDIAFEQRPSVSEDEYLRMASQKTGALLETSLYLGAFLGGGRRRVLQQFSLLGKNLGLAFQIQNDALALWGGKPSTDLLRKKKTFPLVYALSRGEVREELLALYQKPALDGEDMGRALSLLDRVEARDYSWTQAEEYCRRAVEALENSGLPPSSLEELKQMVSFLRERTY